MDHVRIDPKFRRKPRPKRAGWAAREVFKFLLEVSAEFDLRGRFSESMQDVAWLADEWANGDVDALSTCRAMITQGLHQLELEHLLHREDSTLVITDWDEFYKPSQTNAERQANFRKRNGRNGAVTPDAPVTPVTTRNASNESNATEQNNTTQNNTTPNEEERSPPPVDPVSAPSALNVPAVTAGAQPERRAVARVERPDPEKPPEDWDAMDFWRWAQDRRQATGYLPERVPNPRKLSGWWSEARGVVHEVRRLKAGFYRYGDDEYWKATDPPYPFHGFMSQWERFVPPRENSDAA